MGRRPPSFSLGMRGMAMRASELRGENTRKLDALPKGAYNGECLVAMEPIVARVEAVKGGGGGKFGLGWWWTLRGSARV